MWIKRQRLASFVFFLATPLWMAATPPAMAEDSAFSLPPLPTVPVPATPASAPATSDKSGTANNTQAAAASADTTTKTDAKTEPGKSDTAVTKPGLAPLPVNLPFLANLPTPKPESTERKTAETVAQKNAEAATKPPPLVPLPDPTLGAIATPEAPTEATQIKIVRAKPTAKSWETKLAPTERVPETHFNYRREQLPGAIYRDAYGRNNQHLPVRLTRANYASLLFYHVSRNEVEPTRALLNAGVSLKETTAYGETPLALARRIGAVEVAQLLEARGAQ